MQDRYVGDIGDFANNGLLRWLIGASSTDCFPKLPLGVVWYRHTNEPSDGGAISYLSKTPENLCNHRKCDPELYLALKQLVFKDQRKIDSLQNSRILPEDTVYYGHELSYPRWANRPTREIISNSWLDNCCKEMEDAQLIFLNPDNGITVTESPFLKAGLKYAHISDLIRLARASKSLVIYQHLSRNRTHDVQVQNALRLLTVTLRPLRVWGLIHQYKGIKRAYLIVANTAEHERIIERRLDRFRKSQWVRMNHFQLPVGLE